MSLATMDFSKDELGRQKFADLLIAYATRLASASVSPAGRVIAVDAPWGTGKSWIAKRLPEHFQNDDRVGNCVYIDAFQFDFHLDPFAVVTSAIVDELKGYPAEASSLKEAAVKVLKVSLPAIGKGMLKAGGKAIGVDTDELIGPMVDAAGEAGEKAIAQMLESFSQTRATTAIFKKKLSELAIANQKKAPLLIIVDELDRCRPSYALEMLERVKHLFDVQNVVFIFFVHTPALHSAVKKTYGADINPAEYLKKFFSLTLGLPVTEGRIYKKKDESNFISKFIGSILGPPDSQSEVNFRSSLAAFAPAFNASFRDIESAILLWQILPKKGNMDPEFTSHALLVKVKDPLQLIDLRSGVPKAYESEFQRLGPKENNEDHLVQYMRDVFLFGFQPSAYDAVQGNSKIPNVPQLSIQDARGALQDYQRLVSELALEYIRP